MTLADWGILIGIFVGLGGLVLAFHKIAMDDIRRDLDDIRNRLYRVEQKCKRLR